MPAAAAAVRAGIASFGNHPFMVDTVGEPMIVARAPHLSEDVVGLDRFLGLAAPAAQEALAILLPLVGKIRTCPVVIGLPPSRPGLPDALEKDLPNRLQKQLAASFPISSVEVIACGHSAGLMALESGGKKVQDGTQFCLVGGVDSYLEPETLEWLEAFDQIHSAGPLNNAWGFIPGEAAGFCLLASAEAIDQWNFPILAQVKGVATAREKNLIKTDTVCLGRGLIEAFEKVFQYFPLSSKVDDIICDMNGEPYRGDEFGFASLRTAARFVDSADFQTPADCWGDVGAASGPLFANLAVTAALKGYAKGPCTLAWTSSESGERSAALVQTSLSGTVGRP
jgi:3-oxoacyl-[acyl-carrier-protein] synthase-1